jgi:hypothetical protein
MPAAPKLPVIRIPADPKAVTADGQLLAVYRRLLDDLAKRVSVLEDRIRTLEGS